MPNYFNKNLYPSFAWVISSNGESPLSMNYYTLVKQIKDCTDPCVMGIPVTIRIAEANGFTKVKKESIDDVSVYMLTVEDNSSLFATEIRLTFNNTDKKCYRISIEYKKYIGEPSPYHYYYTISLFDKNFQGISVDAPANTIEPENSYYHELYIHELQSYLIMFDLLDLAENIIPSTNKVFLGGTCADSTWRKELIPLLKIDYFNPQLPPETEWNDDCYEEEVRQKEKLCDIHLYVITPKMKGVLSIAEIVESAFNTEKNTFICILEKDGNLEFSKEEKNSLKAVQKLAKTHGAHICKNIKDVADKLNKLA